MNDKKKKRINKKRDILNRKKVRENLDRIFYEVNPTGKLLIPTFFNEVAEKGTFSYKFHFKKDWNIILKRYGKYEEFNSYIDQEFVKWHNQTKQVSPKAFIEDGLKCNANLLKIIDQERLRKLINVKKLRNTDNDYINNFNKVIEFYGRVPTQSEFNEKSLYPTTEYKRRFQLEVPIYDNVLRMYDVPESAIIEVNSRAKQSMIDNLRKKNLGKMKNTDGEMVSEFKRVIDSHLLQCGTIPSTNEFKKLSKIGLTTMCDRFNCTYHELGISLGYEMDASGSSFEKSVLENISTVLNENFTNQATFKWLKSDMGGALRCDGYYENIDLIVEADGEQHFVAIDHFGGEECFARTQANDKIKNTLIPQHNLKLLRIAYDEPYLDEDYLKFKLLSIGIDIPNYTVASNK